MLEMIDPQFWLQLWRDLQEKRPELEAMEQAEQNAAEETSQARSERIRRMYDTAIAKKRRQEEHERNKHRIPAKRNKKQ